MLKIIIVLATQLFSFEYLFSQDNSLYLSKALELVYLDEFYDLDFIEMDSIKDSIIKSYTVSELDCSFISKAVCRFYSIKSSCNCEYIISIKLDEGELGKIYKLKGFRTSEFKYFFNYVLLSSVGIKEVRYVLKNFIINGINSYDYYDYYIRKKRRYASFDKYSCFEKNIIRAY